MLFRQLTLLLSLIFCFASGNVLFLSDCAKLDCSPGCTVRYSSLTGCPERCDCSARNTQCPRPICPDVNPPCIVYTKTDGCQACACTFLTRSYHDKQLNTIVFVRDRRPFVTPEISDSKLIKVPDKLSTINSKPKHPDPSNIRPLLQKHPSQPPVTLPPDTSRLATRRFVVDIIPMRDVDSASARHMHGDPNTYAVKVIREEKIDSNDSAERRTESALGSSSGERKQPRPTNVTQSFQASGQSDCLSHIKLRLVRNNPCNRDERRRIDENLAALYRELHRNRHMSARDAATPSVYAMSSQRLFQLCLTYRSALTSLPTSLLQRCLPNYAPLSAVTNALGPVCSSDITSDVFEYFDCIRGIVHDSSRQSCTPVSPAFGMSICMDIKNQFMCRKETIISSCSPAALDVDLALTDMQAHLFDPLCTLI